MNEKSVNLNFVKATTGTYVYGEKGDDRRSMIFPALYVPKSVLGSTPPPQITVTVKWEA